MIDEPPVLSHPLTKREYDVLRLVSSGLRNREVSHQLGIGEQVVKNYVRKIFDKTGMDNRGELIAWAAQRGIERQAARIRKECKEDCERTRRQTIEEVAAFIESHHPTLAARVRTMTAALPASERSCPQQTQCL